MDMHVRVAYTQASILFYCQMPRRRDHSPHRQESEMTYDNEAIVRHAYHAAEGDVLDVAGFVGSFTEDGVFNNVVAQESYRGEHLGDLVLQMAELLPDVHRELHRVKVLGDIVDCALTLHV